MIAQLAALAIAAGPAPGGPGEPAQWTEGDKDGFGTATATASNVWHTLDDGELTEVYYPDLGTPAARDLQFVVSDGKTFSEREREDTVHEVRMTDRRSLSYRQVNTDEDGRYRITKTYTTDPARSAVLLRVRFEARTRTPLRLYALYDPALSNDGSDDAGATGGDALLASDRTAASALVAAPGFDRTSSGYLGTSDGWTDLRDDHRMDWAYDEAASGNVVQFGRTRLTGRRGSREMTLSLGFAGDRAGALRTARAALAGGFERADRAYRAGWHAYLDGLDRPRSAAHHRRLYDTSLMVLAASEDKTYRGAGIASPSLPWFWGTITKSEPYHLVWSRDLYQVATAQLAAGDRAAAERALDYLFGRQQLADGCFPQNSNLDGSPHWPNLQLDEVADPILLAWQLGRNDAGTWEHVRRAAGCILLRGPTSQERWENAEGYSPATIGAEIAALVCAAEIAERNGATDEAARYRARADLWRSQLRDWTVTTNGPLSDASYFLRLTVDGDADAGTMYTIGDGGPKIDQREVVDTSFLELVRLGVLAADDRDVLSTLPVVDRELGVDTPSGRFWHRYQFDGYGETPDGGPFPGPGNTGRLWPIFAGERGEYELAAGDRGGARTRLDAMAATANDGLMLPEQVWDENPPSGAPGFTPGTGTGSATPLGWTHAQFIRLAWSIDAGAPVERPSVVACRYGGGCQPNGSVARSRGRR